MALCVSDLSTPTEVCSGRQDENPCDGATILRTKGFHITGEQMRGLTVVGKIETGGEESRARSEDQNLDMTKKGSLLGQNSDGDLNSRFNVLHERRTDHSGVKGHPIFPRDGHRKVPHPHRLVWQVMP